MRRVMADKPEGFRIVAGDDPDLRIALNRVGKVAQFAIDDHGHSLLAERFCNGVRDLRAGDAGVEITRIAVGKCQG